MKHTKSDLDYIEWLTLKYQMTTQEKKLFNQNRENNLLLVEVEIILNRGKKELGSDGLERLKEIKCVLPKEQKTQVMINLYK